MSQTVKETSSLLAELTGLFFIAIAITGLLVFTDISFFDDYVRPDIARCHPQNQEDVCKEQRQQFGLAEDAHIEIGNPYWQVLAVQAILLPVAFSAFRALTIVVRRRKITGLRIFIIILWGLVPFILFYFGSIDIFYYIGRGLDIPNGLDWLNNVGIFQYTKSFGDDPLLVERSDLLFTFGLGVIFIVLLFFIAVKMYESSRLRGFV